MTERQAKVFKILVDIGLKAIFGIAALFAFFLILFYILNSQCDWQDKAVLASLEAILSYTVYKVFNHYFPNGNGSSNP
ncbi:hypothetical protein WNY78_11375 [Psychroserpens sp. AS72]|uniref:hypothetical protein n=1 Tax=Psychroserpens sp. AS72 TaxID=3135775 RepID=UPI00317EA4AA